MFDQALLKHLNDGEYHLAQELTLSLEISLVELVKAIEGFHNLGLEIEFQPGVGYRLSPDIKLLDKSLIFKNLSEQMQDSFNTFDIHLTIDSTSSEAMRLARAGHQGKAFIVAESQVSGRGRRGRNWVSPMARNIYMTLVWPIQNKLEGLHGLSLVTALSLVKALQKSALNGMENLKVKWPNDVWLNNKKLAGILLELYSGTNGSNQIIVGIGLNVSMPIENLVNITQAVTDLASHGNIAVDRNVILANLLQQLNSDIELFMEKGFVDFIVQWQLLDVYHNQEVEVRTGSTSTLGKVKGVNQFGALILETNKGCQLIMGGELAPSVRATDHTGNK